MRETYIVMIIVSDIMFGYIYFRFYFIFNDDAHEVHSLPEAFQVSGPKLIWRAIPFHKSFIKELL